jgi:16S rRNA G966 N2-methylase RsmD
MKNLRIPYKGSKNKIADKLLDRMQEYKPNAKHFIDLFGGGGSMSFKALERGYITHYNEIDKGIFNFLSFILDRIKTDERSKFGLFPESWYNFVSREEFIKCKGLDDPYSAFVQTIYSFGNNCKTYLYGDYREEHKRQGHNFVYFGEDIKGIANIDEKDFNKRRSYLNIHCKNKFKKIIKNNPEILEVFKKYKNIITRKFSKEIALKFVEWFRATGIKSKEVDLLTSSCMSSHYLSFSQPKIPSIEKWELLKTSDKLKNIEIPRWVERLFNSEHRDYELKQLQNLERLQNLEQLENLEQLQNLERLENLEQLQNLAQLQNLEALQILEQLENFTINNLSYEKFNLDNFNPDETIIYCDPPYSNTDGYGNIFNHNLFYNWLKNSKFDIFISEYNMCDFKDILNINSRSLLSQKNDIKVIEKLFINKVK